MADNNTRILINLSNHPSSKWPAEQVAAAARYGKIVDIAFPQVPAEDSEEEVSQIADECVATILEMAGEAQITALVMGEFSLTYTIVSRLMEAGITCLAACSERIVRESDNGERISSFVFSRFRRYQ